MILALVFIVLFYIGMAYYIWFIDDKLYRSERYWKIRGKIKRKIGKSKKKNKAYINKDALFIG